MSSIIQPHIRCGVQDAAEYAILPGDPGRVDRVKKLLENPGDIAYNREFRTAVGYYKGVRVLVASTGIGGPSAVIALEELKNIGVKTFIRIGSCGALQKGIKPGELIIAAGAVRNDGAADAYIERGYPALADADVTACLVKSAEELKFRYYHGLIRSHDSFYTDREEEIDSYWSGMGLLGADMESSALFVVGRLRKLRVASILNVVVEMDGDLGNGINDYVEGEDFSAAGEEREIITALEAIVKLENNEKKSY
ncbi:MAG TPA: nucleoside phosphorylase [Clostridia bacterium]|nr:nucleoside phosphorylase [Clostridia bacterium]